MVKASFDRNRDFNDFEIQGTSIESLKSEGHLLKIGKTDKVNFTDDDMPFDGFLGAQFMEKHIVVVDFPNKTCWIKPLETLK